MKTNIIYDVIIVGGGISGLTTALRAKNEGKSILLIEKSKESGGVIQTIQKVEGNFETGPNSFALNEPGLKLIEHLGLKSEMIHANEAAQKRYIFLNNKPTLINPKKLLFSGEVLSFKSKFKLLTERFKKPEIVKNETLADAIRRRFNNEILQKLVNPIVSGIYAGDAEKLEYKTALKSLPKFEAENGSFTKGFMQTKKNGVSRKIVTFKKGLDQLTSAIQAKLANDIVQDEVISIHYEDHLINIKTKENNYLAKKIILSTPAYITRDILSSIDQDLSHEISKIKYPSLLSMQISYPKSQVKKHLDAFGLLIPKEAGKVTLGIINYSSVFEPKSTSHKYNLFIGLPSNASAETIATLSDQAENELREIYKIEGNATFKNIKVWDKAIPQFNIGHAALMNRIDIFEIKHPNIKIIGNWRTGVAIGDCIHI